MTNNKSEELREAFDILFMRSMNLYTHGTLTQYGLDEESALEIVSDLTGLSKEVLVSVKKCRDDAIREKVDDSFETVNNVLGAGRGR